MPCIWVTFFMSVLWTLYSMLTLLLLFLADYNIHFFIVNSHHPDYCRYYFFLSWNMLDILGSSSNSWSIVIYKALLFIVSGVQNELLLWWAQTKSFSGIFHSGNVHHISFILWDKIRLIRLTQLTDEISIWIKTQWANVKLTNCVLKCIPFIWFVMQ